MFKISGFQTKMVFKQRFKYLKNVKINFIKVECLFHHNIYFIASYFILEESFRFKKMQKKL